MRDTSNPERMSREEHRRVLELAKKARRRPHLKPEDLVSDNPWKAKAQNRSARNILVPSRLLGYSSAIALGDAVRQQIVRREEFAAMQGGTIQHVKNGKPLTAHGAKLLGVAWPLEGEES